MKKVVFLLMMITVLLSSCGEYNKILKSTDYELKYSYAKKYFNAKQYSKSATLLDELVPVLKGSAQAEESLYLLAQRYYGLKDYQTASQYFNTYYTTYPKGEFTELARYYSGYGLYLDSPDTRLDQAQTYEAINQLQLYLEYYPLYYFGYCLCYSSFEYSDLKVEERENGNIIAHVNVKNIGYRAGDEVVQLYVTDMYASVKTRITELKDFTRVHLRPGESKSISFELTPYELSLLNDNMDRVVEKGTFKILVGGVSPQYIAKDRIKDSLGYEDAQKGLSVMLEYNHGFAADFDLALSKVEDNLLAKQRTIWISVKNNGTLMDTGKVEMYVYCRKTGDKVHYELAPGEEKLIPFIVDKDSNQSVVFATKYKVLSI